MTRTRTGVWFLAFATFVAYLSFVPFRYHGWTLDEALTRFAQIRYLDLGAGNRADWVANILMFVPLGWLAAAWFAPHPRTRVDFAAIAPAFVVGCAWAVAIEFGQVYFPGRTVSLNDIMAEAIGTLLGAGFWSGFAAQGKDWWHRLSFGGRSTVDAALGGYVLAYVVLSFSPFDVVASTREIADKAASNLYGWWLAPVSCGQTPCSTKLLIEALAVVPFGWWWAMRRGHAQGAMAAAALLGLTLGVLIETAQFLLISGTSQGASVLTRAAGMAAGAWLHAERSRLLSIDWARWGRPLVLACALPYLVVVGYVSGWVGGRWLGLEAGLERVPQVQWLPFYYQYFSTEQALIRSTLVHLFLYAPVGVAVWLWGRRSVLGSPTTAAALAALVAFLAESTKLFIKDKHPDYTDVLIAAIAAWASATLLRWATDAPRRFEAASRRDARTCGASARHADDPRPRDWSGPSSGAILPPGRAKAATLGQRGGQAVAGHEPGVGEGSRDRAVPGPFSADATTLPARAAGLVLVLLAIVSIARFPLWQAPLLVGLAAYAFALVRWPLGYLIAIPVALPVLDLAPLSGRFFWDEFDLLLATTLGVRLLMRMPARSKPTPPLPRLALSWLGLSVLASGWVAVWPLAPLDANAFSNYLSPYNALRVAKGYVWGAAMLWLMSRDTGAGYAVGARLLVGLALGLVAASLGVIWERMSFVGLADLGASFRAAGLVSATHVGGAYLEAILVVLTPFALALAAGAGRPLARALWCAAVLGGAIALLMTLSRAAIVAWAVVVTAFAVLHGMPSRLASAAGPTRPVRRASGLAVIGLVAVMAWAAQSTPLRERLLLTKADLELRISHWRESIALMRGEGMPLLLGMGLGSFPREFYLAQAVPLKLAAYRLGRDGPDGEVFLTLNGGRGMYLDQRIRTKPGKELRLIGRIRALPRNADLSISLCEKAFLESIQCASVLVQADADWQSFEVRLGLPQRPSAPLSPSPPISLSLHNSSFGTRIDVAQLSMLDGSIELLSNGSFEHGLDRWLMHSDMHLAWRALSTPVQILFEQGLLGIVGWLSLGAAVMAGIARRTAAPMLRTASVAAGLGFMAVGSFDALFDAPRLILLAAMVLFAVVAAEGGPGTSSSSTAARSSRSADSRGPTARTRRG